MKKAVVIIALLLLVVFAFVGCKSEPTYEDDPRSKVEGIEGDTRPEWVVRVPKSEELFYVVGIGRGSAMDTVKRNTALIDAQRKLGEWKAAVVSSSMDDYIQESGTPGNTQTLTRFQQVAVTRVNEARIAGMEEREWWKDPEGIYYILYSYPKAGLQKDFEDTIAQFQRNEAAAFADFKAQEAIRALEARMDSEE